MFLVLPLLPMAGQRCQDWNGDARARLGTPGYEATGTVLCVASAQFVWCVTDSQNTVSGLRVVATRKVRVALLETTFALGQQITAWVYIC